MLAHRQIQDPVFHTLRYRVQVELGTPFGPYQALLKPEKVTAYEGGLKSEFLDRRLRINLAGFYYDYKDLQVGKVVNASLALENAATATIYGAELELRARPTPDLELGLTGSYLNAKFDSFISIDPARPGGDGRTVDPATGAPAFNNAGNRLPQAPKWTVDAMAQYTVRSDHGSFALRGEVLWVDKVYFSAFNVPQVSQPAKTKLNASLIYTDPGDRWSVTVYGKNLANIFSFWDVLFGTYYVPGPCKEPLGFEGSPNHNLPKLFFWPLIETVRFGKSIFVRPETRAADI